MANNEPLIPPPSIGESKQSKNPPKVKVAKGRGGGSKLWVVVLLCVVLGVGLGVFVYQQSVAPSPKLSPTPRATATPLPSPSAELPQISQVTPQSNTIAFPKAGEIRVYFSNFDGTARVLLDMESSVGASSVQLVGNGSETTMSYVDTGLVLTGPGQVTIALYDGGDTTKPGYGWIPPTSNNDCKGPSALGASPPITPYISWIGQQAPGEPIVSQQCWGDWGPAGDTSNADFNDYFVVWSYVPESASPSPSPSPSSTSTPTPSPSAGASSTPTPTPTPTPTLTPTPTPKPSKTPTPTPTPTPTLTPTPTPSSAGISTATPTPTPSQRAAMPQGSSLPDAGVFEVTAGTIGIGLLLLLLGLAGLLLL